MSLAEIHKKAKLVMIPSGAKATKLYSVLPSNGDGDFTTTSDTDATRVNKDGLIQDIAVNVPRLDYDFSNPQNPHLLLEPERTNLLTYSEDFTQWVKSVSSIVLESGHTAPDGSNNAFKMTTASNGAYIAQTISTSNEGTTSVFVKSDNLTGNFLLVTADGGLTAQTVTNEWTRVTLTSTPSSGSFRVWLRLENAGDSVFIFGAQLEAGSFATSYIPTSGFATTRTVDTCNSAGNSTIINTSEGVLFAEIAALANDSSLRDISINNNDTDRILLSYLNSSNRIAMQFIDGGASQFTLQFDGATITNFNKIAIKYKSSDYALWVNGSERDTNTSHTNALAGLDRIDFDRGDSAGAAHFFGKCKQLMYFDTILTDAELTTLTT